MKILFCSTFLGFTSYWDYKHYNKYISQKVVNSSTTNRIHLKFDVIDGSSVRGKRQPRLFSFVLDRPLSYRILCEPQTIHYKKKQIYLF